MAKDGSYYWVLAAIYPVLKRKRWGGKIYLYPVLSHIQNFLRNGSRIL